MYQIKFVYPNSDLPDEYELYQDNDEFISINYNSIPDVPIKEIKEVVV